jgi:hypothetical protein
MEALGGIVENALVRADVPALQPTADLLIDRFCQRRLFERGSDRRSGNFRNPRCHDNILKTGFRILSIFYLHCREGSLSRTTFQPIKRYCGIGAMLG